MRKPYEFQLGAQSDRLQPFHQFSSHRLTNSRGRSVVDSGFEQLLSERGYVKNVSERSIESYEEVFRVSRKSDAD